MTDASPMLWPANPHTLAKHQILKGYLDAWMPIVTSNYASTRKEIRYIDGFAGPGEYEGGELGSPVIAANAAIEHSKTFQIPMRATFIEIRKDRVAHLNGVLKDKLLSEPQLNNIVIDNPIYGDCDKELNEILNRAGLGSQDFGPALVFLDQFGYGEVPMDLIGKVLYYQSCEVFTYINFDFLNRFITDETKWESIDRAWGGQEWRPAINMKNRERENHLRETYKEALKDRAKARYICYFSMHDKSNRLLYWLFFCSGSIRGLIEMKKSMWKVDATGSFYFSDRHAGQPSLISFFSQEWLATALSKSLINKKLTVEEVEEYVLTETPCYLYKSALKLLENKGGIEPINPPTNRNIGTFSNKDMKLRFIKTIQDVSNKNDNDQALFD